MLKVLVVDDDSPIRRWLEYCISQLESFVLVGSAATGTQGLEIYRRELPDIVVTILRCPECPVWKWWSEYRQSVLSMLLF